LGFGRVDAATRVLVPAGIRGLRESHSFLGEFVDHPMLKLVASAL
jgi:hypothetical protein